MVMERLRVLCAGSMYSSMYRIPTYMYGVTTVHSIHRPMYFVHNNYFVHCTLYSAVATPQFSLPRHICSAGMLVVS